MPTTFLAAELDQLDIVLGTTWFQQDGATAHTAKALMNILKEMFGDRLISHRADIEWSPRSSDLNTWCR